MRPIATCILTAFAFISNATAAYFEYWQFKEICAITLKGLIIGFFSE